MYINYFFYILLNIPAYCIFFFAFFTIYYHIFLACRSSFSLFYNIGLVLSLLSIFLFFLFDRQKKTIPLVHFFNEYRVVKKYNSYWLNMNFLKIKNSYSQMIILIILPFFIVTIYFFSKSYLLFWGLSIFFLSFCIFIKNENNIVKQDSSTIQLKDIIVLCFLSVLYAIFAFIVKRTDADDALFVAMSVHLLHFPQEALFQTDPLFHGELFRLWPYHFESFNVLSVIIAKFFNIQPARVTHYIFAPIIAALFPLSWGYFFVCLGFSPRKLFFSFLLLSLLVAESHASFGNFTFVRLFQGKAMFITIVVPILYVFIWNFIERPTAIHILKIFFISAAAFGCTVSAVFVVPQILVLALLSGYHRIAISTMFFAILPVLIYYGILAGILFMTGDHMLRIISHESITTEFGVNYVLGSTQKFVLLFFILTCWNYINNLRYRNIFLVLTFLYFIFPLNPYMAEILSKLIERGICWREIWVIPFWGIACIGLSGSIETFAEYTTKYTRFISQRQVKYIFFCLFCFCMLPFSNLRVSNIERFGFDLLWYPKNYQQMIDTINYALSAGKSIAAPLDLSPWLTTLKNSYHVYSHRYIHIANTQSRLYQSNIIELLSKYELTEKEKTILLMWLEEVCPDAIVIKDDRGIQNLLLSMGYKRLFQDPIGILYIFSD